MCDTNDHGCNLKPEKLLSSLHFHETCEGTLSHFDLKPGSEITFVNEKDLRHHLAGFHRVEAQELKPVKLMLSTIQMSLPYKSSKTVFSVGHFKNIMFSLTRGAK